VFNHAPTLAAKIVLLQSVKNQSLPIDPKRTTPRPRYNDLGLAPSATRCLLAEAASMPQQSAGTLLYRAREGALQVLLVHPSGNYNRGKPWSIPKGIPDEGEDLETAARRETLEETGVLPRGKLHPLGSITYRKSRKQIFCFAGAAEPNAVPRCASWEVDCAEFVPIDKARTLLHPDQVPFLDRLQELLDNR
jgi:predicted NUDIX family NTP pyrophosphohydrolase